MKFFFITEITATIFWFKIAAFLDVITQELLEILLIKSII
jgi:hypothetical protein